MFGTKSEFDYQSIIEACGIQDVNIKKALGEKNETLTKFQEQVHTLKRLNKERDKKNENLVKQKLMLNKNLQKLNKMYNRTSTLNKELKAVQDEISQLNQELQQNSNEFVKKMTDMDNALKLLYSQFEGETLTNILSDLNIELLSVQDKERQLQIDYDQLKQSPIDLSKYERLQNLENIIGDVPECERIEEIEKKLANKKKNIEFLTNEYNKKMEWLQKFA